MRDPSGPFVVARMLRAAGVSHVFGIPGGAISPLSAALNATPELTNVLAKHEEGAAFMAQGHAQVTGGVGVIFMTTGPGSTNALTGVANAFADQTPLIVLTANSPTQKVGRGAFQDCSGGNWSIDVVDAYRSITKASMMLPATSELPRLLAHAIRTARSGRPGPVHLSLPGDLLIAPVPEEEEERWSASLTTPGLASPAAKASVEELAAVLADARYPVVLVGLGARISGCAGELVELAERLGARVITTLNGKGVFPEEHPLSLGVFGLGGHPDAHATLEDPGVDVVLAVGCAFGEKSTSDWGAPFLGSATLCQIDADPTRIGRGFPVDHEAVGDARLTIAELNEALESQGHGRRNIARPSLRKDATASELQRAHPQLRSSAVVARLGESLPPDTVLFGDIGHCMSWLGTYYTCRSSSRMFMSVNFASMGYAYGASVGGSLAAPGSRVVAVGGDAAFAMNGMEVHTAVENDLPLIWIVLNNGGHARLQRYGLHDSVAFRHPMDIAAVARGLGCPASIATTLDEFDDAITRALGQTGPYLIDARVDTDEEPWLTGA